MMGVEKANQHKRTRFHGNGFREGYCSACGQWVYVMSYQDDTRWRYMDHRAAPMASAKCENSKELLPVVRGWDG